jgi:hypothetical protein
MNAKTKFLKMFDKLPEKAWKELVIYIETDLYDGCWENLPMSLNVCWTEIKNNTKLGKEILKKLGYEDD